MMNKTIQDQQVVKDQSVSIKDDFWGSYIKLVQDVVIPYQYEALHDKAAGAEPSHAIANFEIAAGRKSGEFYGWVFQDSDVAKWLEAVGYSLSIKRDPELERQADEVIDLVGEAQQEDGYLNTYFTIKEPGKRWTNLNDCHELYCAGHFIEAAVSYYEATGKENCSTSCAEWLIISILCLVRKKEKCGDLMVIRRLSLRSLSCIGSQVRSGI